MAMVLRVVQDCNGATVIEFGLLAAIISLACMVAFQALGLNLASVFMTVANALA